MLATQGVVGYLVDLSDIINQIQSFLFDLSPITGRQYKDQDVYQLLNDCLLIIDTYGHSTSNPQVVDIAIDDIGILEHLSVPSDFHYPFPSLMREQEFDFNVDTYYEETRLKQLARLHAIIHQLYIQLNTLKIIQQDFETYEGFIPFTFGELRDRRLVFIPSPPVSTPVSVTQG